jgi:hypothetical protein
MGAPGMQKTIHSMRPVFQVGTPINPLVSANVDFAEEVASPPNAYVFSGGDGWDISTWDVSLWDAPGFSGSATDTRWYSIGKTGHTVAPQLQLTFGSTVAPDVELVSIDATFSAGVLVG